MRASSVQGADAASHLIVIVAEPSRAVRDLIVWSAEIRNRSATIAYRDLWVESTYYDENGQVLDRRREPVWVVVEPGESRHVQVVDAARWRPDIARAGLRIVQGEPLPAWRPRQ
jgi:hypothetical protein